MSEIVIPPGERGVTRVFALSLDAGAAKALRANQPADDGESPSPIEAALGTSGIDADFVEVFPASDVREIGFDGYLEQGNGIEPAQLDPDRQKLRALDGWVLLLYSAAFGGRGATLHPAPELSLIGTYSEPGVDWSDEIALKSDATQATATSRSKTPSDAAISGRIAMIALLVLCLLTVIIVLIAG